jgi:type IV pilus assembly protein PilE
MSNRGQRGYSLADLVIAMAIVALLATVAVPSYRTQLVHARRAEARSALLAIAAAQETHHYACRTYATAVDPDLPSSCDSGTLPLPAIAAGGAYTIAITAADAAGWSATAAVVPGGPQAPDRACRSIGLDDAGHRTARDEAGRDSADACWRR